MMDASKQDLIAELDMLLTSAQLQEAWEAQRSLTSLPNVVFRAEGYRVVMHFYSHRGSLPGLPGNQTVLHHGDAQKRRLSFVQDSVAELIY